MNDLRLLLERREARTKALSEVLKLPERNANMFIDLERNQLAGAIKAQIRRLDDEIELHKRYIRVEKHVLQ